ncbi:unnamed protein product [Blepharisma stoltei]|uniref:Protein kinase domain-containing protein n=1 Tax=Blepharisma stoltei TaxID=1481888 RepID=A0AAU9IWH2_9CILI|nr:unnamed protein product [Blepharisma stoltei]
MSHLPTVQTIEDSKEDQNLKATVKESATTYELMINQIYSLEESLLFTDDRKEICDALNKHLIDLYINQGLQYSLIPFDSISVKKLYSGIFVFDLPPIAIPIKDKLKSYQAFVSKSISINLIKLVRNARKPLPQHLKIRQDIQFVETNISFRARQSDRYQTMPVATMMDDSMVFMKPLTTKYKVEGVPFEGFIYCHLQHPNIIRCYGYTKHNDRTCLVLQHVSTLLETYVRDNNLSLQRRLNLIIEIGHGLSFMHMKSVVLMNVSPWSIFVDSNYRPIIVDLENAVCLGMKYPELLCYKEEDYASPEALDGKRDYSCDVYSYGLLCYFILTKQHYAKTKDLDCLEENFRIVIEMMLSEDPSERPHAKTCYQEFECIYKELTQ